MICEGLAKAAPSASRGALKRAEHRANSYIMRSRPEAEMRKYRRWASMIMVAVIGLMAVFGVSLWRAMREKARGATQEIAGAAAGGEA